ncbi:UNVERIFIED_ORG: GNAT superfamily N-acetyltransferase [Rhizobium aethiopicum]
MAGIVRIDDNTAVHASNLGMSGALWKIGAAILDIDRHLACWLIDKSQRTAPFGDFDLRGLSPEARATFWIGVERANEKSRDWDQDAVYSPSVEAVRSFHEKRGPQCDGDEEKVDPIDLDEIWFEENRAWQDGAWVVEVATPEQWQSYHDIRRSVLFEARGLTGYNANHPDDRMQGHMPVLLMFRTTPVGAARLDLMGDSEACVRTVAIHREFQGRGFGRALMAGLDDLAARHGVGRLTVHAAPDAVGFYEALGWIIVEAAIDNPLLGKELQADV